MNLEIERKYIVHGDYKSLARQSYNIVQGYLSRDKERTVRIRIQDSLAFITVKGPTKGIARFEWEKEIPIQDASEMLKLCEGSLIEKTRYIIDYMNLVIEVDEFKAANTGLVMAEIELNNADENPKTPEWIGKEVSGDIRYHNSQLSDMPYSLWNKE